MLSVKGNSITRRYGKGYKDYGGDASKIKDIARNTIVEDQIQYDNTVNRLRQRGKQPVETESCSPTGESCEGNFQ
jgi:hypothetical protein